MCLDYFDPERWGPAHYRSGISSGLCIDSFTGEGEASAPFGGLSRSNRRNPMRNPFIITAAFLALAVTLFCSNVPGAPDILLDTALLMLTGAALLFSGWVRSTMFRNAG